MHAISPQMMIWDPATVGLPAAEMQQTHILPSGCPTVFPSAYRLPGAVPQLYAGASVHNPAETQGVVWIQQQQVIAQEPTREDIDAGAAAFASHGLVPGQLPFGAQQQGVIPILMTVNGQRVLAHQQIQQGAVPMPGQPVPGGFIQVAESGPALVPPQSEGVQLVNIAGINHRMQHGIRLTSLPGQHENRQIPLEKQVGNTERPRLTPRRRNGHALSNCDTMLSWRRVSEERSLGGCNTAIRRRSQSSDRDGQDPSENNSGSPTPNKRAAPAPFPVMSRFEFWQAPDSRVLRKLVDIIEYYFSDECLTRNGYMLKQLSNNDGEGYISLRRVASLKRVKSQTRDLRTVAYAVRQSTKLEMDEEGTMIRRKRPLPDNIEAPRFIRSVLAINLPKDAPSVEDVTALFTPYGDLTQVRVLRPGKTLPPYLKDYKAWVPDLGTRVCAVVEFENQDEAQKACREINMQNRGQNSLRVALLKPGARIRRTLYRKYKDENVEASEDKPSQPCESGDVDLKKQENVASSTGRTRCSSESSDGSAHERLSKSTTGGANNNNNNKNQASYHYDASGSGSDTGSDTDSIGSKTGTYRIPPKQESRKKCHNADSGYSQSSSDERDSLIMSPTPTRDLKTDRLAVHSQGSNASKSGIDSISSSAPRRNSPLQKKFIDGVPVGVERQPKGPVADGKGFAAGVRQVHA